MNKEDLKKILGKCFGKNKDDRYHAIAMLAIYGIFMIFVVLLVRGLSSDNNYSNNNDSDDNNHYQVIEDDTKEELEEKKDNKDISDIEISYSYTYSISTNKETILFIGSKVDEKEKFRYIKDGVVDEYVYYNNKFYKEIENDLIEVNRPSQYFKYCDISKIVNLIATKENSSDNNYRYSISNKEIEHEFDDIISIDNKGLNTIEFTLKDGNIDNIDLDFSNYLTSIQGVDMTLKIHMEFSQVGNTNDFDINIHE